MSPNETALVTNIEITREAWQSNPLTHREWDILILCRLPPVTGRMGRLDRRSVVHTTLYRLGGFI